MNNSDEYDDGSVDTGSYVDTSAEEAAVAEAEAKVAEIQDEISAMQDALDQAKAIQQKCEERAALAKETLMKIQQHQENYSAEQSYRLREMEDLVSLAEARINSAQNALTEYLGTNPPAARFEKWLHWSPQEKQIISPREIHDRLNLSGEQLNLFGSYLYDRDSNFRHKIDNYREQYRSARGSAEKLAVSIQVRRGGAGDFAEQLVSHAFQPIGEISTQDRTFFKDGHFTKTDLMCSNVKSPVILGHGKGLGSPVGGSIAIEVKTGGKDYLYRQLPHMVFQAGGHQKASASMTVCSRDIKDLSPEKEQELRDALKDAGSPILGMLPSKDELDGAVLRLVTQNED